MTYQNTIPLADVLREYIRKDRIARLTISSDSMAPLLRSGDVIGLQRVDSSQIQPGQIVTFCDPRDPQILTTHRVAANGLDDQGEQFLVTGGDNFLLFDPVVRFEDVIGQVVWRIRNGRLLHLDQGSGAWLSRQMGKITEGGRRQISGIDLGTVDLSPDAVKAANRQTKIRREGRQADIVRKRSSRSRQLLAAVALSFTRQEKTGVEASE